MNDTSVEQTCDMVSFFGPFWGKIPFSLKEMRLTRALRKVSRARQIGFLIVALSVVNVMSLLIFKLLPFPDLFNFCAVYPNVYRTIGQKDMHLVGILQKATKESFNRCLARIKHNSNNSDYLCYGYLQALFLLDMETEFVAMKKNMLNTEFQFEWINIKEVIGNCLGPLIGIYQITGDLDFLHKAEELASAIIEITKGNTWKYTFINLKLKKAKGSTWIGPLLMSNFYGASEFLVLHSCTRKEIYLHVASKIINALYINENGNLGISHFRDIWISSRIAKLPKIDLILGKINTSSYKMISQLLPLLETDIKVTKAKKVIKECISICKNNSYVHEFGYDSTILRFLQKQNMMVLAMHIVDNSINNDFPGFPQWSLNALLLDEAMSDLKSHCIISEFGYILMT